MLLQANLTVMDCINRINAEKDFSSLTAYEDGRYPQILCFQNLNQTMDPALLMFENHLFTDSLVSLRYWCFCFLCSIGIKVSVKNSFY